MTDAAAEARRANKTSEKRAIGIVRLVFLFSIVSFPNSFLELRSNDRLSECGRWLNIPVKGESFSAKVREENKKKSDRTTSEECPFLSQSSLYSGL